MQTIKEAPYYNLLVNTEIDWDNNTVTFPVERFLEYSSPRFPKVNKAFFDEYLQEIIQYPALILNEHQTVLQENLQYAGCIGLITGYSLNNRYLSAKFQPFKSISLKDVLSIQAQLDLSQYGYTEFDRTHWAVKNVNLKKVIEYDTNLSISLRPAVFISYSWSMPDAEEKVESLVSYLRSNDIEVTYDRDAAKPGMDLSFFMEGIVRNSDKYKKILVLSDSTYTKKANNLEGGVGEEASLIKPLVTNHPNQTQVIPIFMEDPTQVPYFLRGTYGIHYKDRERILDDIFSD